MVGRLRNSKAVWSEDETPVEMIQTHISVILLGSRHVLKLKKPVDFGFLDYSTLEKRRLACEREVLLNSRLCPKMYIGTRAIAEGDDGIRLSGKGNVVEFGLLMKRLPEGQMLDRMVTGNSINESIILRIADKIFDFHQTARRGRDVDSFGNVEAIRFNWEENFEQTAPYIDRTISASDFNSVREWVENWIIENEGLLRERVKQGRICDGHGDLRCESICVTNGICIFDCIEFNDRFRCADVANEAAFLAMDLAAYGRPDLGYLFYERYCEISGDEQLYKLFSFYRCYRAFVRGKVLSFQLDEPEVGDGQHISAKKRAEEYFKIAVNSTKQLRTPTFIMVAGLSGTGKTSVARAIAGELGLRVVSSDAVRKSIFPEHKESAGYSKGIYSEDSRRRVYKEMIENGTAILRKDGSVILDATFQNAADREMVKQTAESLGAQTRFIECRLKPEMVRRRLKMRAEKKDGLSDATWETYQRQISDYQTFENSSLAHLVLDTAKNLSENSRIAAEWLITKADNSSKLKMT